MNMKLNQTSHKKPLWGALLAVVVIAIIAFLGRNFFGNIFASLSIHTKLHRLAKTEMLPLETTSYIDLLETENKNLRELLAVPKENTHALTARIVAWPSASLDGTFIIAAGAKDGVTVGNTVFLSHTIIGTITRVFPTRSIVSPIGATPQSVTFSGKEGVYKAELTGFGSYVIQVPKDVIIEPGETVAIPDYGPSVLGVVVSVDDKNSSSFTKVYVAHPVSIYDARYVEVRIFAPEVSQ
jgi:cell shape-determining protein MreC